MGSFAYQTGMSMGDFLFNTAITGGNQALSLAIMGTGAAADATISAKDRGLTDNQAFALGTIAGAAEIVTEKISLEALLDKTTLGRDAVGYVLKNVLAEGSEEVGSDLINLVADVLISKDKSEWQVSIDAYEAEGMSEKEAFLHAVGDQALNMGLDFLGGAVSGGVMAGAGVGINAGLNEYTNRQTGREFQAMGDDVVQATIQEGLASDPSTQSYQLAQQLQQKLDAGQTLTDAEIGRLYQANIQAIDAEESSGDLLLRAAQEMTQKGRVTNNTAADILDNPSAINTLAQEAGLDIREDMSKSQQRKAVKTAVAALASQQGGISENARETTPAAAQTQQTATQRPVATEQRTVAQQAYDMGRVRKAADSLGENGAKALSASYDGSVRVDDYYAGFANYYEAGISGLDMGKVQSQYAGQLTEAQKFAAYSAGQNDAALSLKRERQAAQYAKVAGSDSGLVFDDYVAKSLNSDTAAKVNSVAKALGVRVRFVDSVRGGTANAQISGSDILVEKNNPNPVMFLVGHEMTHRMQELAPEQYRAFRDAVAVEAQGEARVLLEQYQNAGENTSYEAALDEAAANYAGRMIENGEVLDEFISKHRDDRTLLEKVRDAIRSIISKLTGAEKRKAQTAEGKLTAALEAASKQAASLQGKADGATMTTTRNSLKEDLDNGRAKEETREDFLRRASGGGYAVFEGDQIAYGYRPVQGKSAGENARQVQKEVKNLGIDADIIDGPIMWNYNGFTSVRDVPQAVTVGGRHIFISNSASIPARNIAGHEAFHLWKNGVGRDVYIETVEDNLIFTNPDFLEYQSAIAEAYLGGEADLANERQVKKLREELFAYISGDIHEGTNDEFMRPMFRDFEAVKAAWGELAEQNRPGVRGEGTEKVKFSLKAPVEETRDLLALHNKDEKSILAALELGGLPMPSIAVVKATEGHSQYGPISLVFNKATIDPQADSRNKVYGGDAWTPTSPRLEYEVNPDVQRRFDRMIGELTRDFAGGALYHTSPLGGIVSGETSDDIGKIAEKLSKQESVQAAYLAHLGEEVEPVYREKKFDNLGNELLKRYIDSIGAQELARLAAELETSHKVPDEALETVRGIIVDDWAAKNEQRLNQKPELIDKRKKMQHDRVDDYRAESFILNAWDYYEDGGATAGEIDRSETAVQVTNRLSELSPEGSFESVERMVQDWVRGEIEGLLGEPGIYNGKDPYTPSGKPRSFSQLHYAYNLENIVKAMRDAQSERGQGLWGVTATGIQALATPSYKNIQDIKADSGRLGLAEGSEYDAKVKLVDEAIHNVLGKVAKKADDMMDYDNAAEALKNAASGKKTVDAIVKSFASDGYKISSKTAQDIQGIFKAALEIPTGYFEAKPQRAVGFDEVLAAVIPSDSSEKLRSALAGKGVNVLTYESGNEADRLEKVNSVEGARFSLKTDSKGRELTAGQREYFKDSKVLDQDGQLKVMYRGGSGDFTVFDRRKSSYANLYGRGFYFTDSEAHAMQYGNPRAFYLNITNPVSTDETTITRSQMRKFLKAVAENEDDYSFENYGYGATVDSVLKSVYGKSDFAMLYDVSQTAIGDMVAAVELFNEINGTDFDGLILDTETVTFRSEQAKNIDNRNPTSDPDIRRSLKGDNTLKENATLRQENNLLRERVDYWKGQTKRTTRVTTDKKAVAKAAWQLIENFGADIAVEDIQGDLQSLYDYLASGYDGKDELTYTEARRRAENIARTLVENAVAVDSDMYEQYSDLRNYLRTTKLVYNKYYHGDIPDFNDFRRRNFGRLNLGTQGTTNIDQVYQEMSSLWPEFFNEQAHNHPSDQLLHIAEVLDSIYDITEYNPFSQDMDQAVTGAANEIMELFFDLPQTRKTFADRQAAKLDAAKAKGRQQVQQVREQRDAKLAALREQNQERVQRAIARERETRARQLNALKDRYAARDAKGREQRAARELRGKIVRHAKALSQKLLHPSDKQHIPESLRGAVAAMLESINLESQYSISEDGKRTKNGDGTPAKRTEAFRALKEQYAKIASEGGDIVIDPSLLGSDAEGIQGSFDAVIAMKDTKLADMNAQQLATVWQVVKAVEHSVNTAGKVLSKAKYARTADWAQALSLDSGSRRAKTSLTKNHALIDLETPYTYFSHYGEAGKAIYRMLRDAQDQQQLMVNHVAEEVRKIVDPKTVKKLEETTRTFTTERGEELTLSTAQIMELYELTKRKQAHDHLLKGGVVQPEVKSAKIRRGTDSILLTAGDLANITKTLTPEQVKIADGLQGLTTGLLADYGNRASMDAYGYKKFTEKDYWPIKSAKEGLHSNIEKGGNNTRSIKNIGMAKTTMPHASNALDLAGIFATFSNHAADMTDYASWLCTMEDINRLFNYQFRDEEGDLTGKTIKGLLDRVGGPGSQKYWHNLMEDIQNGINAPGDSPMWDIAGKTIGGFKGAAVGANARVVIQQPTAFFRAAAVLDPGDMVRGLARGVTKGNGWRKALKYSPIAMRKDAGGFDISSPYQMSETLFDNRTGVRKLNDALSAPAGMADAVTWGKLWNACEWATARDHQGLAKGSEAFYKQTAKLFAEVIDQTQVVDGVLQRSNIMRSSNAVVKQATSFMGEPIMSLNLLMRSYDQVRYEQNAKKRGKAIKTLGRAATALVVTNVVNALAQSVIDAMRDDDEDKKYWERFRAAFTGISGDEESAWEKAWNAVMEGNVGSNMNPLGQIPFVKDALSIIQGYEVSRTEMEIVTDLIQAGQTAIQSMGGDGKKTRAYATKGLLTAGAKLFGIPASNLARDMWGLVRSVAVETDNIPLQYEMEKAIYNISNIGNYTRYYDILYRALETGDAEVYEHIYADMVANGIPEDKICSGMESRMKKAQGVDSVTDLERRFLSPQQTESYERVYKRVTGSAAWGTASEEQREMLEDDLYDLTVGNTDGLKLQEKIDGGAAYGIDETDYLLYRLALHIADQPSESGKLGSYTGEEVEAAIDMLPGLDDEARAYLWGAAGKSEKSNPYK